MKREMLEIYFIMGSNNCKKDPLLVLREALEAGITCFQLREKGEGALTGQAYETFASDCQQLCAAYQVPFIINDDVELALKLNTDGIHVGQNDLAISTFREQAKGKIIGVSVHNVHDMRKAIVDGADYVGIGPIYTTQTKKDAQPPTGVIALKTIRKQFNTFPIVAIGGITEANANKVRSAGADGVALISAICHSTQIKTTVENLRKTV